MEDRNLINQIDERYKQAKRYEVVFIERELINAIFLGADNSHLRSIRARLGWARRKAR